MEDDNGLELSLSLAWGQTSSKSRDAGDNSSDTRTEEGDRSNKLINDFKHFLDGGTCKLESATSSKKSELLKSDNKRPQEEEKGPESSNKRKFFFEVIDNQRRDIESRVSINTVNGSNAENEDVADSEAAGSISRHDNSVKKYSRGVDSSEMDKEIYTVFDTSAMGVAGQRTFKIVPEKEFRAEKMSYNAAFPPQSVNILNMPHAISSKECGGKPSETPGNVSGTYGYSSVQMPVLDTDNSRSLVSHNQRLHSPYAGRFSPAINTLNDESSKAAKPFEAPRYNPTILENTRESVSKDEPDKFSSEISAITPGIDSDLKFGGCGSYPNLPWVSTKGVGPNGKSISGVTYRISPTEIKIVCACHGSHMSPDEFVQHASEAKTDTEIGSSFVSLPGHNNPAASAQS